MSKLFITGDIHQSIDIHKLNSFNFKIGNELTKDDILVIAGDAGLVWSYGAEAKGEEKYWRDWINDKPWTTFCVLGNHEAYSLIEKFPIVEFCGAPARKLVILFTMQLVVKSIHYVERNVLLLMEQIHEIKNGENLIFHGGNKNKLLRTM